MVISRQTFPGKGGLVTKATKNRKERRVPILDVLRPVLERLTEGKEPGDRLLVGPRGGALTTATVRDATKWDQRATTRKHPRTRRCPGEKPALTRANASG